MVDRSAVLASFHTFGDLLKYLRRRAQLTQRELSIAVGYSESQISRLEANLRLPDQASLMALFVPALSIQDEPETIQRLLELAQLNRASAGDMSRLTKQDPVIEPGLPLGADEPAHRHNLPIQLTSFIGREKEIEALRQMITTGPSRLVTLTGSGGVGKTRLALRAAGELLGDFEDGVWLVELAPLSNPDLVAQSAMTALGLRQMSGQTVTQVLCEHLRDKRLLLILDNCEHLVSAVAELMETLLRACPHLRILATSREMLGVSGETPFRCPSLFLPDPQHLPPVAELAQYEAVRLFAERAQTSSPGFSLSEANAALMARVCQRLDGIPLAIELAAARVRLLSMEQIASRLEADFHLLTGGSRTALPRHRTLQALIDWSYNLLGEKERRLLLRLSVFSGGWTLEAAEQVCADQTGGWLAGDEIVDLLGQLVDKSLVVMAADASSDAPRDQPRYRMLETIRQYAYEKMVDSQTAEDGELASVRQRHLDYFLALAQQAEPHLRGKGQRVWLERLDAELDNLRLALEWARSNDIEKGLQIATALEWFWHIREYWREGISWLERFLEEEAATAAPGNPPRSTASLIIRGKAINALVTIKLNWADNENIVPLLEEARPIFEEYGDLAPRELARYLQNLAQMEQDLDPSIMGTIHALDLLRKSGDTFLIEDALFNLAYLNIAKGAFAQARANAEECLARAREAEDVAGEGAYLRLLGILDLISGNLHQAIVTSMEAQSCFDISRNWSLSFGQMDIQANVAMSEGNYSQAIQLSEAALAWCIKMNEKGMMLGTFNFLGWEAWALKDYDQATRQCEKGLALARELQPILGIKNMELVAITSKYILGRVALSQGEYPRAYAYLKEILLSLKGKNETFGLLSLFSSLQFGPKGMVYEVINALGVLASAQCQARRAATLFGAQAELYEWQKYTLSLAEREEYEQALASARAALGERAFTTAWEEGQRMTLDQAVAYALGEFE
jgi:non-specific serine/threonine protein kinase